MLSVGSPLPRAGEGQGQGRGGGQRWNNYSNRDYNNRPITSATSDNTIVEANGST